MSYDTCSYKVDHYPLSLPLSLLHRSTMSVTTHPERTKDSSRDPAIKTCTVENITQVSPTTKLLQLTTDEIKFKSGQWVDFMIPRTELVGGYSFCSAPDPQKPGVFELAVKYSTHKPTAWIHDCCKIGDVVDCRVGGDVFLDPETDTSKLVLLIAGGIGINPLLSMMKQSIGTTKYHLLYSASTYQELIFRRDIQDLTRNCNNRAQFYVTQQQASLSKDFINGNHGNGNLSDVVIGHITPEIVNNVIKSYQEDYNMPLSDMRCFMCGPPPMINHFVDKISIKPEFEKWW